MKHPSLQFVDHRPWPLPRKPWLMAQQWSQLLFAHWPVPPNELRQLIPEPLEIDTFEGAGWIGVVPFYLTIRPRFFPVIPRIASFPEINVRTYVKLDGKPGVWFFSLDATSPLAVRAARWSFDLPYFDATIKLSKQGKSNEYFSQRKGEEASFTGIYRPVSDVYFADPNSHEAWLTERYCLYATNQKKRLYRTDVHHRPWPLQKAECELSLNTMTQPVGLQLSGEPLLHYSESIEVVNWFPKRVDSKNV